MKKKHSTVGPVLLALYAGFLLWLSLPYLTNRSFWLDEVFTWELIGKDWGALIADTAQDVHPPLYYLIVKGLCSVFGYRPLVLRLASFLPAVILAFVTVFCFLPRFGMAPAAFFITCTVTMPYAMHTNAEVRMYSWAFLFVTLCGYGLYLVLAAGRRRDWVLFTAMGVCAAYTHYYAFLMIAVLYLVLLLCLWARRGPVRRWLLCFAVSVACYLPWAGTMLMTVHDTAGSFWLAAASPLHETLALVYNGYTNGTVLLALSALLLGVYLFAGRREPAWPLTAAAVCTAAFALIVGYGASWLVRPLFLSRYFYPTCGLLWLSTGIAAQFLARRLNFPWAGLLLVLAALYCFWRPYREQTELYAECNMEVEDSVTYVEQTAAPGDRLVSTAGVELREATLALYFPGWDIAAYAKGWLPEDGRGVFLFTPELGYLQQDARSAVDAAGYTVADSRGVRLGNGYFTVYHLVPGR